MWWRLRRRFYLANKVGFQRAFRLVRTCISDVQLTDAWVWDVYRSSRFVKSVRIVTFKDVERQKKSRKPISTFPR